MSEKGCRIPKLIIVGAGLIGGSFSLALKRRGAVGEVLGIGRNRDTLERAQSLGVIDRVGAMDRETLGGATLVLLATPVGQMQGVMLSLLPHLDDDTIVTDGGSTKQDVIAIARQCLGVRFPQFVPGHPIAGTERSGPEAAFPELYENKRVVLTPLAETRASFVALVRAAWETCGARVTQMEPALHDTVLAAVSHLPHLLSFALVEGLSSQATGELMFSFAGGGFRDFTRIASSNPEMWRDISIANRVALGAELTRYRQSLDALQRMVDDADAEGLGKVFERARAARERWLQSQS